MGDDNLPNWLVLTGQISNLLAALGWPMAIVVVGYIFRDEIGKVLPRISKAGLAGVEFKGAEQQVPSSSEPDNSIRTAPEFLEQQVPAAQLTLEAELNKNIENFEEQQRVPILVRDLAVSRLNLHFFNVFEIMYASQMEALRELSKVEKVSLTEAQDYFHSLDLPTKFPDLYPKTNFAEWLGYLTSTRLVEVSDGEVRISDTGKLFLQWAISAGHRVAVYG